MKNNRNSIFNYLLAIFIPLSVTSQKPSYFKRSECQDQCCAPNTVIKQGIEKGSYHLSFGFFETCNNKDTLLLDLVNDTLRIVLGEKKRLGFKSINGTTKARFLSSDEEECDCYYLYSLRLLGLESIPRTLIVDNQIFIPGRGFVSYKFAKELSGSTKNVNNLPPASPLVVDTLPVNSVSKTAEALEQALRILFSNPTLKAEIQLVLNDDSSAKLCSDQFEEIKQKTLRRVKYNLCDLRLSFNIVGSSKKRKKGSSILVVHFSDTGSPVFTSH